MYEIVSVCDGGGYRYCRTVPRHPKANAKGLYPLHRVLAENKLGRALQDGEHVHHVDHDRSNDDPGNLAVLMDEDHGRLHHPPLDDVEACCAHCGCVFSIKPRALRLRTSRNAFGEVFCSLSCGAKARERRAA